MSLKSRLREVVNWGTREDTPVDELSHIRMTNMLLLGLFGGSIVETASLTASGAYQAAMINVSAPFTFGGGLLLMRAGYTVPARLLVPTISYAGGHMIALVLGPHSLFQLILLYASAFSFTFFPLERWGCILYCLTLPLLSFSVLEATHYEPILGLTRAELTQSQLTLVRVVSVGVVWAVMIAQLVYHILAKRTAREQLVSTAKMAALGQMAAGIAHEVNNPLVLVVGYADQLASQAQQGPVPAEQAVSLAGRIQDVSMRIGAIVHGLQALSRDASRDPFVELPLRPLVNMTLDYCRARIAASGVELRVGEIPAEWTVIGREAQLSEVLLNLLNNALDAAMPLRERWIEVQAAAKDGEVKLSVIDSGAGIPSAVRQRMFDPFFTTKAIGRGTGLGLSISRGILTAHHGTLDYDEASGRTRFTIRVPRGRDISQAPLL